MSTQHAWKSVCSSYAIAILTLLGFTAACNRSDTPETMTRFNGIAMTVPYKITVGSPLTLIEKRRAEGIIQTTFDEIDRVFNKWNARSELSMLNRAKANVPIKLSPELARFLDFTEQVVLLTDGKFDPTIEPLQALWKNKLEKGMTPTAEEIAVVASCIGWDKVHIQNGVFFKDHDSVSLDLGGIAKGLCVDNLVENLNSSGFPDIFVDWGGEIKASGEHPEKRPWTAYISRLNDTDPRHAIATLQLNNEAIATSGDYLQNWSIYKKKTDAKATIYFHVFNSRTRQPLVATHTSIASVSVLAPSCALADGLATAAMLFSTIDEAQQWALRIQQQLSKVSFWIVSRQTANERLISHD